MKQKILVIDDDPINNMLCTYIIKKTVNNVEINCFELPLEGLEHVITQYNGPHIPPPTILFLDINMPTMDGWGFLTEFAENFQEFHSKVSIVILSSSVNPADIEKANKHPLVIGFMPKPIGDLELDELKKHPALSIFIS